MVQGERRWSVQHGCPVGPKLLRWSVQSVRPYPNRDSVVARHSHRQAIRGHNGAAAAVAGVPRDRVAPFLFLSARHGTRWHEFVARHLRLATEQSDPRTHPRPPWL